MKEEEPCSWCGVGKVDCPNCGASVHLDEILGTGCVLCKKLGVKQPKASTPTPTANL